MIFQSTKYTISQKWELHTNFMTLNYDQDNYSREVSIQTHTDR